MSEAVTHLRELAERIGPRPATTDTEAEAADYIQAQFEARGLGVERQEFLAPRTYSWAYVIYHIMTLGAAVLVEYFPSQAFVVALLAAVLMWLDLDTRWGLSNLMPKGPSQNVVGCKPANSRRGEVVRKVVVVAHYDSARTSLAFSPTLVKDFRFTFGLMKWCTWLVVPLTLLGVLEFDLTEGLEPLLWYVTMAAAAYLLVPTLINVHRELFMPFSDGANDNASGVAAMLGVLEHATPEELVISETTQSMPAVTVFEEEPLAPPVEIEEVPEGGVFAYSPASVPDGDVRPVPVADDLGDLDWDEHDHIDGQEELDVALEPAAEDMVEADEPIEPASTRRRRWFGRRKPDGGVSDWLGVGGGFDAVDEGKRIGSWEHFDETDKGSSSDSGSKGGIAGLGEIDDPMFAMFEATRIRHLVTHGVDRGLDEKEIWFVATGSEETGTWGMRAFLKEYEDDLRGAIIINLDNVGTGALAWVTREGMARRYRSDRRLQSAARRAARELDIQVKGHDYLGLSTDATPALARGLRAMSIMAFDINGRLPNWHWKTDIVDNVSEENVERATEFVTEIIKEL